MNILEAFEEEKSEGASLLLKSLKDIDKMSKEEVEEIKDEYNRLFIGPGKLAAPPWASVYLSEERIIFDEHTLSVREFYKSWGVSVNLDIKVPDDHLGYELEFMSIMSKKAMEAIENNNMLSLKKVIEAQKSFLDKHILKWTDEFLKILYKNSKKDYFKGLALFTSEYLKMDKELLEEVERNLD